MAKRRLSTSKPSFTGSSHLPMEIPKNAEQHPCTPLAQTLLVVSTGSQAANHVSCSVSLSKWHCEVQRYALDPTLGSKSVNFWQSYQISLINIKISQPPFALPFNKPLLHRKEKIPKRPWPTGGSNLKTLKSQKISGLEEKRIFFQQFCFFHKNQIFYQIFKENLVIFVVSFFLIQIPSRTKPRKKYDFQSGQLRATPCNSVQLLGTPGWH